VGRRRFRVSRARSNYLGVSLRIARPRGDRISAIAQTNTSGA